MTLNSSGPLSLSGATSGQSISVELTTGTAVQTSLNDSAVRTLLGVASGQISMSSAYGKTYGGGFSPITRTYNGGGTTVAGTETIVTGATTLVIEVWGAGGGGSKGIGIGCATNYGGGGGSGGYSRTSISVSGHSGQTLAYSVGPYGIGGSGATAATAGGNSTVSSGTFSVTTLNGNGGGAGTTSAAGAAGTASGGTVANTSGAAGQAPYNAGSGGNPVTGIGGMFYGGGGQAGQAAVNAGANGSAAAIKFEYT